jgi:2-methylcitrate dehydratase PrpD
MTEGLSSSWAVMDGYSKMHACCQFAHSTVEAVLAARADARPEDVEEIVVATHRLALPMTNAAPPTTLAGKFSLPHIVATTLVHGHADVAAFSSPALNAPAIAALRRKVKVVPFGEELAPPNDRPARVTIRLTDGRIRQSTCLSAPGGPDRPFPDEIVMQKVERLTADVYPHFGETMKRLIGLEPAVLDATWEAVVGELTATDE